MGGGCGGEAHCCSAQAAITENNCIADHCDPNGP
jgi:hypothetical protein